MENWCGVDERGGNTFSLLMFSSDSGRGLINNLFTYFLVIHSSLSCLLLWYESVSSVHFKFHARGRGKSRPKNMHNNWRKTRGEKELPGGLRGWFRCGIYVVLENLVGDCITNGKHQAFQFLVPGIECRGTDFGNMSSQLSVNAGTCDAN